MSSWTELFTALLIALTLKSTIVLLGFFVFDFLRPSKSAAASALLWTVAFVALLALPALMLLMPPLNLPQPATLGGGSTSSGLFEVAATITSPANPTIVDDTTIRYLDSRGTGWIAPVVIWLLGMVTKLLRYRAGTVELRRWKEESVPLTDEDWRQSAGKIAARMGISSAVELRVGSTQRVPMTWGTLRPVVLLPESAKSWPDSRREHVLLHEMAHICRHDTVRRHIAQWVGALLWFHPMVRIAARRLRQTTERACDDLALAMGARPSAYARDLLEVLQSCWTPKNTDQLAAAPLAHATGSDVEERIQEILERGRQRSSVSRRERTLGVASGLVLVSLVAAFTTQTVEGTTDSISSSATPSAVTETYADARPTPQRTEQAQIMIEARIVESRRGAFAFPAQAVERATQGDPSELFSDSKLEWQGQLDRHLFALEQAGSLTVLSAPRLITSNGKTAEVQSGLQIPIQTIVDGSPSVQYVNATLRLVIQATLLESGRIALEIDASKRYPDVNKVSGNPPIHTTEAHLQTIVADGGTSVVSGMLEAVPSDGTKPKEIAVLVTSRRLVTEEL